MGQKQEGLEMIITRVLNFAVIANPALSGMKQSPLEKGQFPNEVVWLIKGLLRHKYVVFLRVSFAPLCETIFSYYTKIVKGAQKATKGLCAPLCLLCAPL